MKKFILSTFFILIGCATYAAVLKGKVIDSDTDSPLIGVNIIIFNTNLGAATDINGMYIINNIPEGRFIVRISYIAYYTKFDTIDVEDKKDTLELNIFLKPMVEDLDSVSSPENEAYHEKLEEFNKIKPILLIKLDSIKLDNIKYSDYCLIAFLSFTNRADVPVYVLKDYPCFETIFPIVKDSSGKTIKRNRGMIDCMGEKTCPDTTDLIKINPGKTIEFPPTRLWSYGFKRILNGKYTIGIEYKFEKPVTINTFYCRSKNNIKALITALRESYYSQNTLPFINKYSNRKTY